ncbi:TPA: hypothetical protein QDC22_007987 [Burkholderia stabilis]|nr:hypothetical protein [Burkholderia stabilis]HDR9589445.1 hypothetical protein [Burkholderia stabilis]HDR9648894.1 hypothetical protein [Burkholderia stabilis]HDR9654055.1 hypothetical protein [Burkholderia stabilis]HDR9656959.1 hypothetical protein [Burkholderia stabilis]
MKSIVLSAVMVGALSSVMLTGCVAYPGPAQVTIGWHGDRYWDGNRYWERRDWEAQHSRGYDDRRDDHRDDHRDDRRDDQRPQW